MPWHVMQSDQCPASKPWAVMKDEPHEVVACHGTEESASQQLAALYAAVAGGRRPRYQRIAYRTRLGLRSWYETVVCPLDDGSAGGAVCRLIGWAEHFHQAVEAEIR